MGGRLWWRRTRCTLAALAGASPGMVNRGPARRMRRCAGRRPSARGCWRSLTWICPGCTTARSTSGALRGTRDGSRSGGWTPWPPVATPKREVSRPGAAWPRRRGARVARTVSPLPPPSGTPPTPARKKSGRSSPALWRPSSAPVLLASTSDAAARIGPPRGIRSPRPYARSLPRSIKKRPNEPSPSVRGARRGGPPLRVRPYGRGWSR
mmetsp:Transcript_54012/g.161673  ORF Transcript_54012/g.161673 Transcript_54012/m.161673 type:complete len:209 (+) Transcript_54012:1263-1889(+)